MDLSKSILDPKLDSSGFGWVFVGFSEAFWSLETCTILGSTMPTVRFLSVLSSVQYCVLLWVEVFGSSEILGFFGLLGENSKVGDEFEFGDSVLSILGFRFRFELKQMEDMN